MASQRLDMIQEPEKPNICKHSLNAGTQFINGNLPGMESFSEILGMEGFNISKTGLSRF